MDIAVRQAVEAAALRKARHVAFAASMLDAGLLPGETAGAAGHMVRGLAGAIDMLGRLHAENLASQPLLERWIFDVGAARFDAAVAQFRGELAAVQPA